MTDHPPPVIAYQTPPPPAPRRVGLTVFRSAELAVCLVLGVLAWGNFYTTLRQQGALSTPLLLFGLFFLWRSAIALRSIIKGR
jgi:hypothetical protein